MLLAPTAGRATAVASVLAPGGTLRATYIVSNLAQATRDPSTGEIRGVAADVARELGRRAGLPVEIIPVATAADVISVVRSGQADIGFVAPNGERMGGVAYSRIYMLVQQSFLVPEASPIRSVGQVDQPGNVVGANAGDSISLYMRNHFDAARVRESGDYGLREAAAWMADGSIVAFGGNRQRLRAAMRDLPGLRLLPDNLYDVPQAIAVPIDRPDALAAVNAALEAMRADGFLEKSVARSGVDGITVAPP